MNKGISPLAVIAVLLLGGMGASVQQSPAATALTYDAQTRGPAPIPPSERTLQTAAAESWFKVSDENHVLEGAIFDSNGNLLVCDVTDRRVLRLAADKKHATIATVKDFAPGGLALHKDGRLFIAAMDLEKGLGTIVAVSPDGSRMETIIAPNAGYLPNDLVFDERGGFYFTDFKGTSPNREGGVYYASPDFRTITPVLRHLAMANGVALSPDGKTLWATEFGRNLLHRIELADATTIATIGASIPYHFIGPAPDSMRTDADGNVYVAMYGQGRVLAFNKNGIPIGQIVLPGREQGKNLLSTSLAIRPGRKELYAVASNATGTEGAAIFQAKAFGNGLPPFSARRSHADNRVRNEEG